MQAEADLFVELVEAPMVVEGRQIRVERAWLPMILVTDVPVVLRVRTGLSQIERFALEALLALQSLDLEMLDRIAAIPPTPGKWLLASLVQKGLASRDAIGRVGPRVNEIETALEAGNVVSTREQEVGFLIFPRSNEAIVVEDCRDIASYLRAESSQGQWPVDVDYQGRTVADIVEGTLKQERIYGPFVDAIVEVRCDRRMEREMCPAYVFSGRVNVEHARDPWQITMQSENRERRGARGIPRALQCFELPGAEEIWREQLRTVEPDLVAQLRERWSFRSISIENGEISAKLPGSGVRELMKHKLARRELGVRIRTGGGELIFDLPLHIGSGDKRAEEIIAFDEEVARLATRGGAQRNMDQEMRARVYDRLWELRLFAELYELRAHEDFAN